MTEAEWQQSTDTYDLLSALRARKSAWPWTTRKARLFACGCCRRAWPVLTEPTQRAAIELAERAADKQLRPGDLAPAWKAAAPILLGVDPSSFRTGGWSRGSKGNWDFTVQFAPQGEMLCNPAGWAATPKPWGAPCFAANDVRALLHFRVGADAARQEQPAQCALLREVVGPARPLPSIDPTWLAWNGNTIPKLAQAIYEERRFADLPILADALEEAGCDHADILAHCRSGGAHVRGCWVVDLLLGKA
jgi:hypothetical protein